MLQISIRELEKRVLIGEVQVSSIIMAKYLELKGPWPVTSYLDGDPAVFKSRIPSIAAYLQNGAQVTAWIRETSGNKPTVRCQIVPG